MGKSRPFHPVKLIVGLIAGNNSVFRIAEQLLVERYGAADTRSALFAFELTDYYQAEMGAPLKRMFLSFERLVDPDRLSDFKLDSNLMEEWISRELRSPSRVINIDPGILRASSLVMATVKDFSHRIPLREGIYAHLELLFGREDVRLLPWTYPDFRSPDYHEYLLSVRRRFLDQLRKSGSG
jgi:uncharacterized protein DUF4416